MGMLQPGAAHGGLPCMVARRHFTFIGGFMLLIDYDQPQIRKRCKECGTRTDHNTDLPAPRALHLGGALGVIRELTTVTLVPNRAQNRSTF